MLINEQVQLITLDCHGGRSGKLTVAECGSKIPFVVQRVFYIHDVTDDVMRGCHANRDSSLFMACLHGSCTVRIRDGQGADVTYILDDPNQALYIPKMVWKEMYAFENDAVLMVLSDMPYNAEEYISDYEEYKRMMTC